MLSALRGFKLPQSRSVKSLMARLGPLVAAFLSSTSVQSLSRFSGLSMPTQDVRQKGAFQMLEAAVNVTTVSFADGAAVRPDEPGEHLLHERHGPVSAVRARAQDCPQEVPLLPSARAESRPAFKSCRFGALAHSEIVLHLQVLGSAALHRTERAIRLHHSSPPRLVRDHGEDLLEPPAHHPPAVRPHGLSPVC